MSEDKEVYNRQLPPITTETNSSGDTRDGKVYRLPFNEVDLDWLRTKIRNDFDKLDTIQILYAAQEIVERATRFGFLDLASEMLSDMRTGK